MKQLTLDPSRLLVITGPCSLEDESTTMQAAEAIGKWVKAFPQIQFIFKGSFDKANRTSLDSPRGPGLEEGLKLLQKAGDSIGLPTLTDFHIPDQAVSVAEVADVLQIPAFLCRQTDMLVAAAKTGAIVNVKKGQFLSPAEMKFVIDKLEAADAREIWQTERGASFGYQNLVVDMRNFGILKQYGHPVIFDATHSVQMPGAGGGTTSGKREFVPALIRAALAAGANGLFIETHPDPSRAISDGPNQIPLEAMPALLTQAIKIWETMQGIEPIDLKSDS